MSQQSYDPDHVRRMDDGELAQHLDNWAENRELLGLDAHLLREAAFRLRGRCEKGQ